MSWHPADCILAAYLTALIWAWWRVLRVDWRRKP